MKNDAERIEAAWQEEGRLIRNVARAAVVVAERPAPALPTEELEL